MKTPNVNSKVELLQPVKKESVFRSNLKKMSTQKYLQIMALVGVLWMLIFNYIPMFGVIIAFKQYSVIHTIAEAPWVGLAHFKEFIQDENLWNVVKNTLGISLIKLFIGFPLPIIFALFLNELMSLRLKKAVQTITYLPHFLSWVILGGILTTWLSDTGLINEILLSIGVLKDPINFLADPKYFWGIVIISDIWKELGWSAIIYLAAIAGIDPALYEAAKMDGASKIQNMWYITLPAIRPTISILFILAVSGVLNSNFDQILVLRNSLNASASNVADIYVYTTGIQNARYSYATAVGLIKSVIAVILLIIANKVTQKIDGTSLY